MQIEDLNILFAQHPEMALARRELQKGKGTHLLLSGLHASARAFALSQMQAPLFIVMDNGEAAQYLYGDLRSLYPAEKGGVYFFPSSLRRRTTDEAMAIQRTETLGALMRANKNSIVVTYPEAIAESVPSPKTLEKSSMTLRVGQEISHSELSRQLTELGFEHVDFVFQPGQYAIRGSIIDIYSYSHDIPYRFDFFGDEIDSIREFDIEDQLSKNKVEEAEIVGRSSEAGDQPSASITDYLNDEFIWVSNEWSVVKYKLEGLGVTGDGLQERRTIEMAEKSYFPTHSKIAFDTLPQPVFHKQFDLLTEDIQKHLAEGYKIYILAEQKKQLDRLQAILGEDSFIPINATIHEGFVDRGLKVCCYTDHQIFERFHRVRVSSENARRGKAIITLREINQLQIGDYVVHSDHGIARFGGLVTTPVNGKPQEMIKLNYRDGANVFVSIHNLHRISKYRGREGSEPTIARLGSGQWERLKERTKDKVKDIARDLIRLYATRKQQQGFAYSPDGYMQHELEASFLYEDTPDQAKATADVKHDLESPMPMDRLVCGDVGFGKTEVAMRAAFKVATDGKQVAVLVPTTVLALQHYNTFRERMKNMPVRIEYISRLKSAKEIKELLADLEAGKIDILIGTHKIIGKNVKWHDLGLLIIDEEQKFGVAAKEKLKSLRANIDVLTLTATPIPRTLQFSLLGARDLSVMTTPPPNRYPVQTELITIDDEDIIKEAIDMEMERNGQIFIVSNRIEMLPRIENRIRKLCPEARIIVAHGQLPAGEMEERLEAFINYDADILISTTIIESGVDIPNVNTILIFSAHQYGLADLHQLRGRVGRSNRKAYCYLIAPEKELLTEDARRRLEALSTFAELGAGFNLAMQDLDIRGAGNLLGAEQSGFMEDLGYETYQKILNQAMAELRNEATPDPSIERGDVEGTEVRGRGGARNASEQPELGANHKVLCRAKRQSRAQSSMFNVQSYDFVDDCALESDIEMYFPDQFVPSDSERMLLYRELDNLANRHDLEASLEAYRNRLRDRFGAIPEVAEELIRVVPLRVAGKQLGVEKIMLKQQKMILFFVSNPNSPYYQSEAFGRVIEYATKNVRRCNLREVNGKRSMVVTNISSVDAALSILKTIPLAS